MNYSHKQKPAITTAPMVHDGYVFIQTIYIQPPSAYTLPWHTISTFYKDTNIQYSTFSETSFSSSSDHNKVVPQII